MAPDQPSPTSQFLPIADAADARAKARQLLDAGADTIKIFFAERGWVAYQPRAPRPDTETIVKRKVSQLREAGVILVFGSDEGSAGELARHATWLDADLWVRVLGMDPMMVLRHMTLDAAQAMGADRDSGSIAAGKYADVIAVSRDPLQHINVLRDPKVIIRRGRRHK